MNKLIDEYRRVLFIGYFLLQVWTLKTVYETKIQLVEHMAAHHTVAKANP